MNDKSNLSPNYLFEVSWEVCNKVGGIHTVVSTKALTISKKFGDNYILIGPDVYRDIQNPEFAEDPNLLRDWKQQLYEHGIRVRIGRWRIKGNPIVILIDFSSLISSRDTVLADLWTNFKVDSITGGWDYMEPVLFGHAAGMVIANFVEHNCSRHDRVMAHFHEWMTSSGGLYLRHNAPMISTVFTTHATALGRSIAGNGLSLYNDLEKFNANDLAKRFGIMAKHSLERTAAKNMDCFATVSDITARECKYLLGADVSLVTPNGFEDDFVWDGDEFTQKRDEARAMMINVAELCLGKKYTTEPLIVGTSGRYEYRNKGIDVFLDSLIELAERGDDLKRDVLAYITVPAGNNGPRIDLKASLESGENRIDTNQTRNLTHYLSDQAGDPVMNKIKGTILENPDCKVQVIFVPSYLQGDDGIFGRHYYELLVGMDLTVYPSYYEPWGYTPLESIAFSVPTVTTTLAGFGLWVDQYQSDTEHPGVEVILRNDTNNEEVSKTISESVERFANMSAQEHNAVRINAKEISELAKWETLAEYYYKAYGIAMQTTSYRTEQVSYDANETAPVDYVRQQLSISHPNWVRVMVERDLPDALHPLEELTKNLWWSWTTGATDLFKYIDEELWADCEKNPISFLDNLNYARFKELENDTLFMSKMQQVYTEFRTYMDMKKEATGAKVAYFSMEYGIHSSLKIYSGGLGILAGDYMKEASDKNIPMIGVGLLYRYGYFTQRLSANGDQEASYEAQNFYKLPISPVRDKYGNWKSVQVAFPGRMVTARIWRCDVGRTELYLLDTDHDLNLAEDRSITYHLYGGDWENRLKQEMLLGIGGIRALKELEVTTDVYHCNEGHAAFIGLERIRRLIEKRKLSFNEALEVVRSSQLFTTHTPVPAGHDAFPEAMLRQYISHYPDRLGITWEQLLNLGKTRPNDPNEKFSMSFLACNLSQEINGVSWLHGEVSKDIFRGMWPGYFPGESHINYVTNGVHFPTWTAPRLKDIYAKSFGSEFTSTNRYNKACWQNIHNVPDSELWSARLYLKEKLVKEIKRRVADPKQFRFDSPRQMIQIQDSIKADVLTIGFARRFATYKRAYLLFENLDRLDRLVNNPDRPVQFLFAGKAHPNDKPGQDLIKRIVEVAAMPHFVGKILFLQNYDIDLARRMVQGVDVWLNTPTRPQEASGTSGEKAVMNGVLHFSVLDGWWVEGYRENAGWALPMEQTFDDNRFQDEMDTEMIYNIIEEQIAPKYYKRDADNMPVEWLKAVKYCIADVASNFTTYRMITDYENKFYKPLAERNKMLIADNFGLARQIAAWKRRVSASWDNIRVEEVKQLDISRSAIKTGESYRIEVVVDVDGLTADDIGVEVLYASQITSDQVTIIDKQEFEVVSVDGSRVTYATDTAIEFTGTYDTTIRLFAKNSNLPHRMDFALVKWA